MMQGCDRHSGSRRRSGRFRFQVTGGYQRLESNGTKQKTTLIYGYGIVRAGQITYFCMVR